MLEPTTKHPGGRPVGPCSERELEQRRQAPIGHGRPRLPSDQITVASLKRRAYRERLKLARKP